MIESRHSLPARTQRLSVVEDAADTTITVNHGGGSVPARPDFSPRPVTRTMTTTRTTPAPSAPASRTVTETHRQVNWGGVLKGAAIVAGVVLVAVVAATVIPSLLTSIGLIGSEGVITGVVEAVGPTVSSAATSVGNGLIYSAHLVEGLLSNAFTALGGTAAVESVTATASAATTSAVNSATAALAGGAAFAAGVPLAVKSMMATPITETVVHSQQVPIVTGAEHATTTSTHHTTTTDHSQNQNLLGDLPEVPDLHDEAAAQMKTASKVAHHAAHSAEAHAHDHTNEMPEAPDAPEKQTREALRNGASRSAAWAERVGRREAPAAVTPRSSQFAEQLSHDRAELESALKTHSV